jgi:plastocyanin
MGGQCTMAVGGAPISHASGDCVVIQLRSATAAILAGALILLWGNAPQPSSAQTATGAQPAQHWQVQVDNISPAGHNWSFNSYYPSRLQAHAGDSITFTVAKNPNAFHTVELLAPALMPEQGYPGFAFRDEDDDPPTLEATFFNSKPFFGASPSTLCGRGQNEPCVFMGTSTVALKSGVLVNPPPDGSGAGNPSFTLRLDGGVPPGTYFFVCLVHGPSMSGSIDVLPPSQPAQTADVLKADADRSYTADLDRLDGLARSIQSPTVQTTPTGSRSWGLAAGGGSPDTRLSIDEFGVHSLFIRPGDTVTWTNMSPSITAHTVTGFGTQFGQPAPRLDPYQPVCGGPDPDQNGETAPDTFFPPGSGRFAPDIWNDCLPWQQEDHLTDYSLPSVDSGSTYTSGAVTSGLLLNQDFLSGPIGYGLPFASTFTLAFPTAGTYTYACMIHYGMVGTIVVTPTPTPMPAPGS